MHLNSLIHRAPKAMTIEEVPRQSVWTNLRRTPHMARMNAEMLLLFAILLVIDHGLFSGRAFDGLEANPYWVPVLTMAVGYGSGMGLAAAIVATAIWITAPHVSGISGGNGDHLQRMLSLSVLPMLWVIVALAVGELTSSRTDRVSKLARRAEQLDSDLQQLADTIEQLALTNRSLQVLIATQENTVGHAIAAAIDLVDLDQASQIQGVERLIALAAQTEDFTFYEVQGHQFVARFCGRSASSQPDDLSWAELADTTTNRSKHGRTNGRTDHARTGNLALPIHRHGDDELIGVLAINGLQQSDLTESKFAELAHVAQSIAKLSDLLFGSVERFPVAIWSRQRGFVA